MIKQSASIKRNTSRFLLLLVGVILVLQVTSCGCNNFGKAQGSKDIKNTKNIHRKEGSQDEKNPKSTLQVTHDVSTNQIKVTLHNKGTEAANMQLSYENISPDTKGKTALLDSKSNHTLVVPNVPAGGSKDFALAIDFGDSEEITFKFQVQQNGSESTTVNKNFQKPFPKLKLKLMDRKNSIGLLHGKFPLYYSIRQEEFDKIPIDPNELSLKITNQGEAISYNNQPLTELVLSGTQVHQVNGAMDRLPVSLGPNTTSVQITLQLFYEGKPMGDPKIFSWQANHPGPTQELFNAIIYNDLGKTTKILTDNPTLINAKDTEGNTALHKALENENIDKNLIQLLLDQGAKLDVQNKEAFLVDDRTIWFDETFLSGETPFHTALANENITPDMIKLLLDKDPNVIGAKNTTSGQSPLFIAARNKKMTQEMIDLLISRGANPLDRSHYDFLPVMYAASTGNRETFDRLFEKTPGIDVNIKDKDGNGLLALATWRNNVEVIKSLLSKPGIEVNPLVKQGNKRVTLLHSIVTSSQDPKALELLVRTPGNNIDVQDTQGNTPLHTGVKDYLEHQWPPGYLSTIEVLLQQGANKDLANNEGVTTLQLVAASTDEELRKLFGM